MRLRELVGGPTPPTKAKPKSELPERTLAGRFLKFSPKKNAFDQRGIARLLQIPNS